MYRFFNVDGKYYLPIPLYLEIKFMMMIVGNRITILTFNKFTTRFNLAIIQKKINTEI